MIEDFVPADILALRTETNLAIVSPWFEKSLSLLGDVVELGCFRGTLSIKYAYWIKALDLPKRVFAFDTFEGFKASDPVGAMYTDNNNAFSELVRWGKILPLIPIQGDARKTVERLRCFGVRNLSFVWFDLDMDILLEPVRVAIAPFITVETIIGVDDYGRPETPTVKPWADKVELDGNWRKLAEYPEYIAFYRMC